MERILKMLCGEIEMDDSFILRHIPIVYNGEVELRYSTLTGELYNHLNDSDINVIKSRMASIDLYINYILILNNFKELPDDEQAIVQKFFDHLLLEIKRKQEYILQNEIFEDKVQAVNRRLEKKQNELKLHLTNQANQLQGDLKDDLNKKSQQLEQSLSTNIITVLGIFAAFITAFMGGIGAFGSIMQNINQTNVLRFIFTLFLFGMIYFDTCYTLIFSVSKMLNKPIHTKSGEACGNIFKKYPIFCWFNVAMILGMGVTVFFFYFNMYLTKYR